ERKSGNAAPLETVGGSLLAFRGEHVLAVLSGPALWDESGLEKGAAVYHFDLAPGESAQVFAVLPAFPATAQDVARFSEPAASLDRVMAYWQEVLAPMTQIETPDPLLNNIVRASQVHCLLAARNEERGKYVAAYISADRYGPLESEAHSVIRGMDLLGAQEYARRALEYFVKRYAPEVHLTTGYTLMGTGWHLWTLAEHFQRTGDTAWLAAIAPDVARACGWVARECEKTKVNDARGAPLPEYGLVPPGVAADWNRFAYRFIQEGHYYAGLAQAAAALAAVGHPDAPALEQAAAALRGNVQRAYRLTQDNSPVLPLADGTWVRPYPGMLNCFGRIEDMIPGEDANRSWAYDVELGAHHLALLGVLDPQSREVGDMLDHMEDFWFLHSGMGDYPEERNRADWFNLGGWAKIQPYYARNAELYALRDDIKPFIRSYFNTIPTLLSLENLSFWEHFHNMGGWNKTHETGYFLAQTRTMFVMERGNELWLALFVPEQWFGPGQRVSVQQAPTTFGAVGFALMTDATGKELSAEISPPATSGGRPGERTRKPVEAIVLRLRPLGQHAPRDIQVAGAEVLRIDQATATVHLKPGSDLITLRVTL
ncbi:MAG: hypothetical protein HYV26_22895, partial [Candidatus Hydrogenedentes bacterium]|nr:hypothetical protein [Candidatus Hydrogenedentota bacterium]